MDHTTGMACSAGVFLRQIITRDVKKMDTQGIRLKVDVLAADGDSDFSYDGLLKLAGKDFFWASQVALARCYQYQFNHELGKKANLIGNVAFYQLRAQLERDLKQFLQETFLNDIPKWDVTQSADAYIPFLSELIDYHACSTHPFFTQFLIEKADYEDLRFYLAQEMAPRFDDLLALIQIGSPIKMKMEFAKNYWDEMGNGTYEKVHASMFAKVLNYFNVNTEYAYANILCSSLVSDNLSTMLALYRENYARAVGYLAVTEYCVPMRFRGFIRAARRLNLDEDMLAYHVLHTDIDGEHAEDGLEKLWCL